MTELVLAAENTDNKSIEQVAAGSAKVHSLWRKCLASWTKLAREMMNLPKTLQGEGDDGGESV